MLLRSRETSKRKPTQKRESSRETECQPEMQPPLPRAQTKITKNYASLKQIPEVWNYDWIQELYLSHNQISCVREKLRLFKSLRNLNLSYNLLNNPQEVILELKGISLRRLCIRMNKFDYGYEDIFVREIRTLERIESLSLGSKEHKAQVLRMAGEISRAFLPALIGCRNLTWNRCDEKMKFIAELGKMVKENCNSSNRLLHLKRLKSILLIFLEIGNLNETKPTPSQIKTQFSSFVRQLLLRFSARFNNSLLISLSKAGKSLEKFSPQEMEDVVLCFGNKYGGRRHELSVQKGQYLEKVDCQKVMSHPMMRYIDFQVPETRTLLSSGTKMEVLSSVPQAPSKEYFFENIPIIIYELNYLEILTEICHERVRSMIIFYDPHKNCNEDWLGKDKMNENRSQSEAQILVRKQSEAYIFQGKQSEIDGLERMKLEERRAKNQGRATIQKKMNSIIRVDEQSSQSQTMQVNLEKYSMHEITLAFKVLRALKLMRY